MSMIQCQKCLVPVEPPRALCAACDMELRLQKITPAWFEKHLEAFASSYPNWALDTLAARLRLAQHLYGNLAMVLVRAGDSIRRQ